MRPPGNTDARLGVRPVSRVFGNFWGSGAYVLESFKVPWVLGEDVKALAPPHSFWFRGFGG